jgi:chromatin segregation and condensation protein Rec8/ScpA/Scc1 (kleisin family)
MRWVRAAVSTTFIASLELAKQGNVELVSISLNS